MVSKRLMGCWTLFDVLLLGAGGLSVAMSIVWRSKDLLRNMVFTPTYLNMGLVLGISLLVTFLFSVIAIVKVNHKTMALVILNYMLLLNTMMVIVIGTAVWFPSLRQRSLFHKSWADFTRDERIFVQDKFSCCGYFNASDIAEVGGSFCTQTQVTFLNALDLRNDDNAHFFCVKPVTAFTDYLLENTFSTIYAFMVPALGLLLATICLIYKRKEAERFKLIDAKRGGKGFV